MLKQLTLENWKSFRHAVLYIDPLTVLIGANASGKSNAIEALEFLSRIASELSIKAALTGDSRLPPIRGGADWIAFFAEKKFTLSVLLQGTNELVDYLYSITISTKPNIQLVAESLKRISKQGNGNGATKEIILYKADASSDSPHTVAELYGEELPALKRLNNSHTVLTQLTDPYIRHEIREGVEITSKALKNIFILNPVPSHMRDYTSISDEFYHDGSNIAGVLAALPDKDKAYIESVLSEYAAHLPERDIQKVWAEPVGRLGSDAMLYCEESWASNVEPIVIDAREISDGTLRFLAVLTALLTRPEGSQLVVEEVDNGLHSSRIHLLLKMLQEIGEKRQIDILVTTHNPALMNSLEPGMLQFITVAHRDSQTGESKLSLLEDIDDLPKLLASGPLGKIVTQGSLEQSLSNRK